VAEEGTHDELLARNEIYAELYHIQSGASDSSASPTIPVAIHAAQQHSS